MMNSASHLPDPELSSAAEGLQAEPGGFSSDADKTLATLLSRLAALQGYAVPAYRFSMFSQTRDGQLLHELSRVQQAAEMWRGAFPEGVIEIVDGQGGLKRGQDLDLALPGLWICAEAQDVRLVRGSLSGQRFSCESADGITSILPASEIAAGSVLCLATHVEASRDAASTPPPRTAGQWFRHAIWQRKTVFLEGIMGTVLMSALGLAGSLFTMQVYDRVVPQRGYSTLLVLTIGVVLAMLLEFLIKQVRAAMIDRACEAIDEELSGVFFQKALAIRMDARPRSVGTFAAQIRQFEMVRNFLTSTTLFILADVPFALLFIGVIAMIGGVVALVPLLLLPLAVMVGLMVKKPLARITELQLEESNLKNGLLIESIDGIESVKAVNAEWKMLDRWRDLTATIGLRDLQIKALSRTSGNLSSTIQQFSYMGMIIVGVFAIGTGDLTMGGLIACSLISSRALGPISQIPQFIVQWQHAKVALKGLDQIMALPSDGDSSERQIIPEQCQGALKISQAVFAYSEKHPVVEVASLQFRPGERVAVLGAVGSGKSTLLKLMTGLYRPTSGTVALDGIDMMHLAPGFVREHIGYLPQDVRLFKGTLRDNLALGLASPSDGQILQAARATGLDRVIANHPKGLGLEISEGGRGLSGGQKQLVGLTRLLLAQPSIMLLDEPTASMDGELEMRVMGEVFRNIAPKSVLVVVTHKLSMLPHVNRVIVMDRGRIVLDGPRDQVLAKLKERQLAAQPGLHAVRRPAGEAALSAAPAA